MTKAVLITKIDPTYDDLPEERYHFPRTYLRQMDSAVGDWIIFYNHRRPRGAHGGETPVRVYRERLSASGPGLRPDLQPTAMVA